MVKDPNLKIRLERAQSWLDLTKTADTPEHARFIFYWIAFNSMYGLPPIDPDHLDKERESQFDEIREFLAHVKSMSSFDRKTGTRFLDKAVRNSRRYAQALIEDPFLSREYWEGAKSPPRIESACKQEWELASDELKKGNNDSFLYFAFSRLIVLRNEVIHGSATASPSSKGYPSLQSGVRFLEIMAPAFFDLLETYGDRVPKWPKAPYPRRDHPAHPHP